MVCAGVTDITGSTLTVMGIWAEDVHPFKSPVTVYVIEEEGLAITFEPVVELNAVEGLHAYVLAPLANNPTGCPLQMV